MPFDSTPRTLALCTVVPGSAAPTSAQGTFIPGATFGAPHTTSSGTPLPTSTVQTVSRSAFGCLATLSTCATTTPVNGLATGSTDSTSNPDMVRRCASSGVVNRGSTIVLSQLSGNCMTDQANCRRNRR